MVGVGGGQGAVPKALTPATKDARFVVQGFEDTIGYERKALLED